MNRFISLNSQCLIVALLLLLSVGEAQPLRGAESEAAEQSASKPLRVLSIGNSFSRNATRFFDDLAKADGQQLVHQPIIVGGASLELHANKADAHELDPEDPAGLYAGGKSLVQMLQEQPWDVVTIQQVSIRSHDASTYQPYADRLVERIRKHAPQAKLMMHQTWAYRVDDPRFAQPSPKPGEPVTQEAMYRGLSAAYRKIAGDLGAGIIPVGDAFYLADTDPKWGFQTDGEFDFTGAEPPALPDQTHSLHVGWRWRELRGMPRLSYDGHHANTAGEYLGACVWYEVLFDQSVVDNSFVPEELDAEYAKFLRQIAHQAVKAQGR